MRLPGRSFEETFITIPAVGVEPPASLFQRLYGFLAENPDLRIVRQDVFGIVGAPDGVDREKLHRLSGGDWPVTWVEDGTGNGCPVAGIQVQAVEGVEVKPVKLRGRTIGAVFEDDSARYCVLGSLGPEGARSSRVSQARATFDAIEQALELVGMDFSQVYRTWFYLDEILDWYDEFNQIRNRFFRERKVFDGLVPASTGVGGSNAAGTAVVADLLAVAPKSDSVQLEAIPSPLQCPALEYGSSFSRAVEMRLPGQQRVYVSGTASIAPEGETVHIGDVDQQVRASMDVVAAILDSRQLGWNDVTRVIGYFKNGEDTSAFGRYCREHELPDLPAVIAKNDICRDDLLFEIELDAAART